MTDTQTALADDVPLAPLSPLALHVRRTTGPIVGRLAELNAVRQELAAAKAGRLTALTLEGEPGVGKTRLLLAAAELAAAEGFAPLAVTADEEIRGPFLLARAIVTSTAAAILAEGTAAGEPLAVARDALSGSDDPSLAALAPDQKLLRVFDLGAHAVRSLAAVRPLALLVDDLQWADEDSVRLLRYLVRSEAALPVLIVLASRLDELAFVTEAANLIADMERMGIVRRLRLGRFTQVESAELLGQALGAQVHPQTAATMHAQAEGVAFILEELARAYREAGLVQEIDGVWKLARNVERLVPSAVRTLIQRRAARVPEGTRKALAEASILGRNFSLKDLQAVKVRLGDDDDCEPARLAEALAPAVAAGLLVEHPEGSPADYSFTHDQIREFSAAALTASRRRAIHSAVVDLLTGDGDPDPASLSLLAHHAVAAGEAERAARFSTAAARAALDARAPEEVLRIVEQALPAASSAQDRVGLLTAQDDALEMLRRPADRLDGLADLAALAEALGDSHLELDVLLRRAAAMRLSGEGEIAAELARRVRSSAAERRDGRAELDACLELGQNLLQSPLGESFSPVASEVDLDGAAEAYARACALGDELGDAHAVAAATRELGVIDVGRLRALIVERLRDGDVLEFARRATAGEPIPDIVGAEVIDLHERAQARYHRALELFEQVDDRRGVMSSIIALAYVSFALDIHVLGSARRIEEIRRLSTQMELLARESERGTVEAQMLYGVHVFARAKGVPDLALSRGEDAYRQARMLGDRSLEFALACGLALTHVELGELEQADDWLDRAAAVATAAPTPLRARQLEAARGVARAAAGDADGLRTHLERAVSLADGQRRPAARCEALARLALEAARLGAERGDDDLLALAERSARDARDTARTLPGHAPFAARAQAALAEAALARGDGQEAAEAARKALAELAAAHREDLFLDVVLPAARALVAGGRDDERRAIQDELRTTAAMIGQRILDEDVRVRWFRGPLGRQLSALAGMTDPAAAVAAGDGDGASAGVDENDARLLWLLVEGRTNREIARELGVEEGDVERRLREMYATLGVSSKAEAVAVAFRQGGG